jgi:ferredoxin
MKFAYLKKIRIAVSLLFLSFIVFVFIDITGLIPPESYHLILFLQFIPSLMSFINGAGAAAAGFIIILILTLLFGRLYCSSVCPLGTLQDGIIYIGKKFRKKRKYTFSPSHRTFRYSVFAITVILFISGSVLLVSLLDPYSNAGRIFTSLFKPLIYLANNTAARIFEYFDMYLIYPQKVRGFSWIGFIFASSILILIVALSIRKERLFCNTLCPVGALLGLTSRFSLVKIELEKDSCTSCGLCEGVCKGNCIDKKAKTVDFERCVSCYNCFTVCPKEGVIFTNSFKKATGYSSTKREFIKNTAVYFFGLTGFALAQNKIIPTKESTVPVYRKYPVSPPGAERTELYNTYCTACHLCVSACPGGVLQPSFLEYGFSGMLQPRMDFIKGFCNFECTVCLDVCPTDAIKKKSLDVKKLIQVGKAIFVKDNCIVETEKKDCGACSEHCPTKAVNMIPVVGANLMIPEVKEEYCIGCGACEFACPTIPYKAIYVEGNPVHEIAKIRRVEKIDVEVDLKEEFPF